MYLYTYSPLWLGSFGSKQWWSNNTCQQYYTDTLNNLSTHALQAMTSLLETSCVCLEVQLSLSLFTWSSWTTVQSNRECYSVYRKSGNFRCSNIFGWPAGIRKLKTRKISNNGLIKQWDNTFVLKLIVVACCLVCLLTMLNRSYTERPLRLDAIRSDTIRCLLEWSQSTILRGSLSKYWISYAMVTTIAWWPSHLLCRKLRFDGREVMPRVSRN